MMDHVVGLMMGRGGMVLTRTLLIEVCQADGTLSLCVALFVAISDHFLRCAQVGRVNEALLLPVAGLTLVVRVR